MENYFFFFTSQTFQDKKPKRKEYHKQSKEYLNEKLKFVIPKTSQPTDLKQNNIDQDADQNLKVTNSNQKVEPRAGFGPATITLPR